MTSDIIKTIIHTHTHTLIVIFTYKITKKQSVYTIYVTLLGILILGYRICNSTMYNNTHIIHISYILYITDIMTKCRIIYNIMYMSLYYSYTIWWRLVFFVFLVSSTWMEGGGVLVLGHAATTTKPLLECIFGISRFRYGGIWLDMMGYMYMGYSRI